MKDLKHKNTWLLYVLLVVFAGCYFIFGVREYTDTNSYLKLSPIREPIYAIILYIISKIGVGQSATALLQNILAAIVCYRLLCYLYDSFNIQSVFVKWIMLFATLTPYVITPFFTQTKLIITNALLTEGITVSLYLLFFEFMLHVLLEKEKDNKKYKLLSLLISLILILTRGQMLITLIAWFIIVNGVDIVRNREACRIIVKKIVFNCMLVLILLVVRKGIVGVYNEVNNGVFAPTPYGQTTIFANLVYVSDLGLLSYIEDEELRNITQKVYYYCDEQKLLMKYAPSGFIEQAKFYENVHDEIKMNSVERIFGEYIEDKYGNIGYLPKLIKIDEMSKTIIGSAGVHYIGNWIKLYTGNNIVGLIRSVAVLHRFLYIPVFLGYMFLIIVGFYLKLVEKSDKIFELFLLVALLTAGTVGAVSLTIMCLSRYMIYNMPLIYLCGILMIRELLLLKKKEITKK